MTKPLYEPSESSEFANHGFRIRQLERRPAPLATSVSEHAAFAAYLLFYEGSPASPFVVGPSTGQAMRYDWWHSSDDTVFTPLNNVSAEATLGVDEMYYLKLLQPGHYTITMSMWLDDSFYGHKQEWNDGDPTWGVADSALGGGDKVDAAYVPVYNTIGFATQTITKIYPHPQFENDGTIDPDNLWPDFDLGGTVKGQITAGAQNVSGVGDNNVSYAILEVLWTNVTFPPLGS